MSAEPETYYFPPTAYAPNNRLPVMVYRDILPKPLTEQTTTEFLTKNKWNKGGAWGHIPKPHFHPNTHECYGIFRGTSMLRIGAASFDEPKGGDEANHFINVSPGDVIILPAGTCHSCIESEEGYRYIGVYPEGSPKWRSCYGGHESQLDELKAEASSVPIPECDPAFGADGPLRHLWTKAGQGGL